MPSNILIDLVEHMASLSISNKLKVGAIIYKDQQIISKGYNRLLEESKYSHKNCEYKVYGSGSAYGIVDNYGNYKLSTYQQVLHAEMDAITAACKKGIATNNSSLLVTHCPCEDCATMIVASGITEVFFLDEYKNRKGFNLIKECGITIEKVI